MVTASSIMVLSTSRILGAGQEQVVGRKHKKHRQSWTRQSHETMTLHLAAPPLLFWMPGLRCQGSLDQRGAWTVDLSRATLRSHKALDE